MSDVQELDYGKVFNHLCHFLALSKEVKLEDVIDNLLVSAFAIDGKNYPTTLDQVIEIVQVYFSVNLARNSIETSLDRLEKAGRILHDESGYHLPPGVYSEISTRVQKAEQLENQVRDEWLINVHELIPAISVDHDNDLWEALKSYMFGAFNRHGVQTIQLLDPNFTVPAALNNSLSSLLNISIREKASQIPTQAAREAIRCFFKTQTSARTRYVAQLLDGTFSFFALSTDEATSGYFRRALKPMAVFLDTNFIFGIFNLHNNPLVNVSHELVSFIMTNELPFTLYYHPKTLDEMKRTIYAISNRLLARKWPQALSRAALRNGQVSGLELRYHELNAKQTTDPEVFLGIYEHSEYLLQERGFVPYKEPELPKDYIEKKGALLAEYRNFIERRRHFPKPDAAYNHDMTVWLAAEGLRESWKSVLESGALFLSCDYYLYAFDKNLHQRKREVGLVVLPNHFLQMLRPFVPATDDFDRRFVETFAIPEFRTIESDYAETVSKVLSYLATLSNVSEETVVRILANQLLIEKIKGVDEDSDEFVDSIESALASDNDQLLEEVIQKQAELDQAQTRIKLKDQAIEQKEAQFQQIQVAQQKEVQKAQEKASAFQREVEELKIRHKRQQTIWRIVVAVLAIIAILLFIFLFPPIQNWTWLSSHPKKIRIYAYFVVMITSIGWAIADPEKDRKKIALGVLAVGAILGLIAIL